MAKEPLEPGCLYHIYNHAVGSDKLFRSDDNYYYFLKRYLHFIEPVADTYCYCLMPNHIHLFIEIKRDFLLPGNSRYSPEQFVSKQFSNLFSSYSQAFNKQQSRRGNLFISNFKRKKVDSDEYITSLIRYIHFNPKHHGFVPDISSWKFSSFNILNSASETFLARDKVIEWFGNQEEFKRAHESGLVMDDRFDFEL
jgi:REP element-mobilizing transposase RayT